MPAVRPQAGSWHRWVGVYECADNEAGERIGEGGRQLVVISSRGICVALVLGPWFTLNHPALGGMTLTSQGRADVCFTHISLHDWSRTASVRFRDSFDPSDYPLVPVPGWCIEIALTSSGLTLEVPSREPVHFQRVAGKLAAWQAALLTTDLPPPNRAQWPRGGLLSRQVGSYTLDVESYRRFLRDSAATVDEVADVAESMAAKTSGTLRLDGDGTYSLVLKMDDAKLLLGEWTSVSRGRWVLWGDLVILSEFTANGGRRNMRKWAPGYMCVSDGDSLWWTVEPCAGMSHREVGVIFRRQ